MGGAALLAVTAVGVASTTPVAAAPAGGVDPATVELTLGPGQAATVGTHVTTPQVAPRPDIVILGDTTGGMDPVVANVRNNIDTIMERVRVSQPTARFGIAGYKEVGNGDKVFTVYTPLTDDPSAVRAGMDTMSHDVFGGGAPWTDFINAHFRLATDAVAHRPNGSRVILWFGDASSHDPSLGHTLADATNALRANGNRVVAVPVVGTSGDGLDRLGQATSIVNATGGRLMPNTTADQTADALLAGLLNLDVAVTPSVTTCDPRLDVGFDAPSRTVRSGTTADFGVTVRVRPDAAPGTYRCAVDYQVNAVTGVLGQSFTVHVPGAAPRLSVGDVTVTEGNTGTTEATFPVSLDQPATSQVSVRIATADGTAAAPADYAASSATLTFAPGETSQPFTVAIVGDAVVEPDESFTVSLSDPVGAAISDGQGVGTIVNDDTPHRLSISDTTVVEGNTGSTPAMFTITLDTASPAPVTVHWATSDGTAVAPGDYTASAGDATLAPGQTSRTVTVPVAGDLMHELDESFTVTLSNPVGADIADGQGVGTIINDDPEGVPRVSVDDVRVIEGDAGSTAATFTISLNQPSPNEVRVRWATSDGTAVAPGDYAAAGGGETLAPGQTSRQVTVAIAGDTTFEPDESFTVVLSDAVGADIADGQGVGVIVNDDREPPRLSIGDVTVTETDAGTAAATFTVTLDRAGPEQVGVRYATADGTATAPGDFLATSGDLTFPAGVTSRQVTVDVVGDQVYEQTETFTVALSAADGAEIVDGQGVGTIVDNDPAGVFTCSATATSLVPSTANPANTPCRNDSRTAGEFNARLGLLSIRGSGPTASTEVRHRDGATSRARLSSTRISTLALTVEVGTIESTAAATCVAGPAGPAPRLSGGSTITALKINGVAIPVGSAPVRIPLLLGTLELNTTLMTQNSVVQRAFALTSPLGNVVLGEAKAGFQGGDPCRR